MSSSYIHEHLFPLTSIILNNISYQLYSIITINKVNNSMSCIIPVPDHYPNTPFVKLMKQTGNKKLIFANLFISFGLTTEYMDKEFSLHKQFFPWRHGDDLFYEFVFLHSLYVEMNNTPEYILATLPEERIIFKGLGKLLLCETVKYALRDKFIVNPQKCYIFAEADGGYPNISQMSLYEQLPIEKQVLLLFNDYPFAIVKYLMDKSLNYQVDELPSYISRCEENGKLIEYYKREYGFELIQDGYSPAALIATEMTLFINKCNIYI